MSGIGRVSTNVLALLFDKVSVLESDEQFIERAKDSLGNKLFSPLLEKYIEPAADRSDDKLLKDGKEPKPYVVYFVYILDQCFSQSMVY